MAHAKPTLAVLTLFAVAATIAVASQSPSPGGVQTRTEWRYYGGNKGFTRYSALDQINRDNVKNVRIAWRRPALNDKMIAAFPDTRPNAYLRATPIMIDGVLYTQDAHGLVIALDGETGRTIWEQPFGRDLDDARGASTRGVDYWRSGADRRIFAIRGEYLYAVDATTGVPVQKFGTEGRVLLRFNDRQPLAGRFNDSTGPLVLGNVVVVTGNTGGAGDGGNRKEAAPEDIRGFDAETGKLLWTFHVVPQPGEFGNDTWGNGSWKIAGDLGAWNPMTADEELGYVYIPLTSPTAAWYGGWRPGDNLFSNSLVALDVKTGKRVWHFQTVHHDLWDWDNIGPPMLGEITVDGKRIRAVMQANKAAFLYVLDRTNGRPVWPIEERPVPQSTVPGERSSPTQPFPTKPPAFDLQGISDDDLIDYTPALKERARTIARQYVMGPVFSPPSVPGENGKKGTLVQPGAWGSANWNTGAFDPDTGYYYAISQTLGPANRTARKQTGDPRATMEYADFEPALGPTDQPASQSPPSTVDAISIDGLPIIKGPYGRITAIDLNRGVHVWMRPNGDGPRFHPLLKDLNLPPLGYPNRPAPLLTKTLLFLGEGSDAISGTAGADWTWGKKFRAYDKATGGVIWEMELPSGTTAGPMTYEVKGKQYIVVAIGARNHPSEYVALSLP
ncbi:MAG TPA: PQQ-binding-like beta-propeller repeat protein [Vicinamibacterales bacterium]